MKLNPLFDVLFFAAVLFAFQGPGPKDIPPTDDPTHPGQPAFCLNHPNKAWKANCDKCKPKPGSAECRKGSAGESFQCKVYCRKHACLCADRCHTS